MNKDKVLQIFSIILLIIFLINLPKMFDYEVDGDDSLDLGDNSSTMPSKDFEDDLEFNINRYENLPSIKDVAQSSSLSAYEIEFSQPDKLKEEKLTEEDNKSLFFFGEIDPVTEEEVTEDGEWGDWGGGENLNTTEVEEHYNNGVNVGQPNQPQTTPQPQQPVQPNNEVDSTPYEVTLDQFLGN